MSFTRADSSLRRAVLVVAFAALLGLVVGGAALAGGDEPPGDLTEVQEYRGSSPGFGMVARTDSSQGSTTSQSWSDMPGMRVRYVVSQNATSDQSILITLSAESNCQQNPKVSVFCWVRVLVDGNLVAPGQVLLNSVEHGPNNNGVNAWGSHTAQWVAGPLGSGVHIVQVQYRVDESNSTFLVDNRTLSVMGFRHNSVTITP